MKLKHCVLTLLSFCMCIGMAAALVGSEPSDAINPSKVYPMSLDEFSGWYADHFWAQAREFDCPIPVKIEDSFFKELVSIHAREFNSRGHAKVLVSSEIGRDAYRAIANIHEICDGLNEFRPGRTSRISVMGQEGTPIEFNSDATRLTLRPVNPYLEGNSKIRYIDFVSIVDHHAVAMETLLRHNVESASEEENDTRLVQLPTVKAGDAITN